MCSSILKAALKSYLSPVNFTIPNDRVIEN